jgi:hypothetical protein
MDCRIWTIQNYWQIPELSSSNQPRFGHRTSKRMLELWMLRCKKNCQMPMKVNQAAEKSESRRLLRDFGILSDTFQWLSWSAKKNESAISEISQAWSSYIILVKSMKWWTLKTRQSWILKNSVKRIQYFLFESFSYPHAVNFYTDDVDPIYLNLHSESNPSAAEQYDSMIFINTRNRFKQCLRNCFESSFHDTRISRRTSSNLRLSMPKKVTFTDLYFGRAAKGDDKTLKRK